MLKRLLLPVFVLLSVPVVADTLQDFDSAGSVFTLEQEANPPGATVMAGGPTGNFLRLVSGSATFSENTIAFDRTDAGAFCAVTIDFDFRITPASGSADGLGVSLLSTGEHLAYGAVPSNSEEEPNIKGSLGVGFDVFPNGGELNDNHVSIHFDGAMISETDASPVVDLDGTPGQFIHARITVAESAGSGDVSVELTAPGGSPVMLIDAQPVAGLSLYEARLQFGARTGLSTADHDLDNIQVSYATCPSVVGQWGGVIPLPIVAIHADLLPTGDVLIWDRDDTPAGDVPPYLFDPATEQVTAAADPGYDLFCAGHSYLPDGTLFVTGGHDDFDGYGLPYGTLYDPSSGNWTTVAQQMNAGRWYPTNAMLANGDTLVISGMDEPGMLNKLPQVFRAGAHTWRDLDNAVRDVPLYSFFHLAPNGMVFGSGPETTTRYLDTSGSGQWIVVDDTGSIYRGYGSSVLYDFGKVLITGGGSPPTRTAQVIDLNATTPVWSFVDSMEFERRQVNAAILADGEVLVTGGTSSAGFNVVDDAVFAAELWDPVQQDWTTVSAAQIPRIYHSFSLLLPDARVLTGGGGHPPGTGPPGDMDHYDVEIYSPPYLFRGPRPQVTAAPSEFGHADTFLVETPDPSSISAVHLIRLAAVTHSFNQSQWINRLAFVTTVQGVEVTAPATGVEAPPGPYMLFLLDDNGVPSVAPIVQLLPDSGRVPAGSLTVERLVGGDITLDWGGSCAGTDDDYAVYEGTIGDFAQRSAIVCSTGGATSHTFSPGSGGTYYLVAPRNDAREGSYGIGINDFERLPAAGACVPQALGACP